MTDKQLAELEQRAEAATDPVGAESEEEEA